MLSSEITWNGAGLSADFPLPASFSFPLDFGSFSLASAAPAAPSSPFFGFFSFFGFSFFSLTGFGGFGADDPPLQQVLSIFRIQLVF